MGVTLANTDNKLQFHTIAEMRDFANSNITLSRWCWDYCHNFLYLI